MKVERKFLAFEPIKLEINLETIEDLQWLMAIADIPINVAKNTSHEPMNSTKGIYAKPQMTFFQAIRDVYKEYTNG